MGEYVDASEEVVPPPSKKPKKPLSAGAIVAIVLATIFLGVPLVSFGGCVACSLLYSTSNDSTFAPGEELSSSNVAYTIDHVSPYHAYVEASNVGSYRIPGIDTWLIEVHVTATAKSTGDTTGKVSDKVERYSPDGKQVSPDTGMLIDEDSIATEMLQKDATVEYGLYYDFQGDGDYTLYAGEK